MKKTIAAAFATATVIGLAACGSSTGTASPAASPTKAAATPAGTSKAGAPTSAAPKLTTAQKQAAAAARNYLAIGTGFSRQGLIDQLSSSAGNGFAVADATYAVDSLHPDWNAQAVLAAKSYLATGTGFSHASLLEQLTSSAGSKFTAAQAAYAVAKVGL